MPAVQLMQCLCPQRWLAVCVLFVALLHGSASAIAGLSVTWWGAAECISGALAVLETPSGKVLIDCGSFFPEGEGSFSERQARADRLSAQVPAEALDAQALIITHAHLDHIGRLPVLFRNGFKGRIFLTPPTLSLAEFMLAVQVRYDPLSPRDWLWSSYSEKRALDGALPLMLHWNPRCPDAREIRQPKKRSARSLKGLLQHFDKASHGRLRAVPCSKCAEMEAAGCLSHCSPVQYGARVELWPGTAFTMRPTGHLPGAAAVSIDIVTCAGTRMLVFSGDVGSGRLPLLEPAVPAPDADVVFIETTYPRPKGTEPGKGLQDFRSALKERLDGGGSVLILAYGLDRTQQVLYQLSEVAGFPGGTAVHVLSPTANRISALYRQNRQWFREGAAAPPFLSPPGLIEGFQAFPGFDGFSKPAVILATDTIFTRAFQEGELDTFLGDPKCALFLVGFQDPDSSCGRLKAGARELRVDGRTVPIRSKIEDFGCFSGHADAAEMDRWLAGVSKERATLVLVHGAKEGMAARMRDLLEKGWRSVKIAHYGELLRIDEQGNVGR